MRVRWGSEGVITGPWWKKWRLLPASSMVWVSERVSGGFRKQCFRPESDVSDGDGPAFMLKLFKGLNWLARGNLKFQDAG